ncbi:histidine--tRNA ligase [Buchnera aphidicola]|uniref:Histidine--tRNA ligase n=1 Tax=Buchnera aphidicola subsp. Cinara cedri (strain Cc) TaxID=372461 RepID=Q057Q0_BUCCC|nr:histidine--tRNA ligase [Buchnera aphidicola]ABJ90649.1 histidyl-tRNA synthetase [Buchnera aphidicola BCc]
MNVSYRSIRGMHDLFFLDTYELNRIEVIIKNIVHSYAFSEIRLPIVEETRLFTKAIGNDTDIINKEMYNFYDKKKKKISLRPEGTVGCIRACIQNNIFYQSQIQKFWYHGPMFRYERPQKGRFRQFHQFGIELFGSKNIISDYELIILTINIWKKLNILKYLTLEINSIGSIEDRVKYSLDLNSFLKKNIHKIKKNKKKILLNNSIRLLDNKDIYIKKLLKSAPILKNYLNLQSCIRFKKLCNLLHYFKIKFIINKKLVRGLDYYNDTVFEWKSNLLGSKNTICAGGRYDHLVKFLGGKDNPAIGVAIGMDRLLLLIKSIYLNKYNFFLIDVNIIFLESIYLKLAIKISEELRVLWPVLKINTCLNIIKKKNFFKYSKTSKSKYLLILSSTFLKNNKIHLINISKKEKKTINFTRIFQNPCIFNH